MLRNLIGPSLNRPGLSFVLAEILFWIVQRGWAHSLIQERGSLVMIPRTEAALDAATKSFNLVIVESETEIAFLGLHRHAIKKKTVKKTQEIIML